MVADAERLEDKLDKISEEIKEQGKVLAVQEEKLREINHRIANGHQHYNFSQELLRNDMNKRLDTVDRTLSIKVDIEDYKDALKTLRDTMAKERAAFIVMACIIAVGGNAEMIKKLVTYLIGAH